MNAIRNLINLGKQCFDQKQYEKAEQYFRRVLSLNQNYADVLNMLGVIHHLEGKFSSAIDMFKKALKINPRYTEALLNLAVLLNDLGRYQDAKKLYTHVSKGKRSGKKDIEPVLKGKLSNLHAEIGDLYRSVGLYPLGIDEYKKALQLNPAYVDIKTKLGQAYRENGELLCSAKELREALQLRPRYMPAHLQLGVTYYSMGKKTEAIKEWSSVLNNDPKNDLVKMYLRLCQSAKEKQLNTTKKKSTAKLKGGQKRRSTKKK